MKEHRFVREGMGWYIDLPEYLLQGGDKGDLQMVSGADTMLDIIAEEKSEVTLPPARGLARQLLQYIMNEEGRPRG